MIDKRAIRELERDLRRQPDNLPLRLRLAAAYRAEGRTADAVQLYRSVAVAYHGQRRLAQAIAVCKSVLELEPGQPETVALLAELEAMRPQDDAGPDPSAPSGLTPAFGMRAIADTAPPPPPLASASGPHGDASGPTGVLGAPAAAPGMPPRAATARADASEAHTAPVAAPHGAHAPGASATPRAGIRVLDQEVAVRDLSPVRRTPVPARPVRPVMVPPPPAPLVPPPLQRPSTGSMTPTPLPSPMPYHEVDADSAVDMMAPPTTIRHPVRDGRDAREARDTAPAPAPLAGDWSSRADDAETRIAGPRSTDDDAPTRIAGDGFAGRVPGVSAFAARASSPSLDVSAELETRKRPRIDARDLELLGAPPPVTGPLPRIDGSEPVARTEPPDARDPIDQTPADAAGFGALDDEPTNPPGDGLPPDLAPYARPARGGRRTGPPPGASAAAAAPAASLPPLDPGPAPLAPGPAPAPSPTAARPKPLTLQPLPARAAAPPRARPATLQPLAPRPAPAPPPAPAPSPTPPPPPPTLAPELTSADATATDAGWPEEATDPREQTIDTPRASSEDTRTDAPRDDEMPTGVGDVAPSRLFEASYNETLANLGPDGTALEGAAAGLLSVFTLLPAQARADLERTMVVRHAVPGELILREGERGDSCFVIGQGEVRVLKSDPLGRSDYGDGGGATGEPIEVARLGDGSLFGEFALLADRRRHASVEAVTACELYEVPRRALRELAATYPEVGPALERFYRERLLATLLATAPFFQPLPEELRAQLLARFVPLRADSGHAVVTEGERSGGLYLIVLGAVDIVKRGDAARPVLLATLREGAYVGEMSLLSGQPASASVIAAGPVELAFLPPRDFYDVVAENPALWDAMRREASARSLENARILAGDTSAV